MTSDADLQLAVAVQYQALADVLAPLSDEDWTTPSLCEGWRVREVMAHVTMPARYDQEAFMAELRAHDFDFGKLSNDIAARDGQLPTDRLLTDLRSEQLHLWAPPEGGYLGALSHVVIHGLDVTVPLGIEDVTPDDVVLILLDQLTEEGKHQHFGVQIQGRRFEATDLDWSWGEGKPLRGIGSDLVLALAGRKIDHGRLEGSPIQR
jgi:uncharacterized protein (TIGR03083 family)